MNIYYKYVPNVYLAKCDQEYQRGDIINITTKYGKENPSIVFNLIFKKDGFYYYSIVREDGFNVQEHAKRRAERLQDSAVRHAKKSEDYYKKSNKDRDFLSLFEPIKVGHHSERRHRRIIREAQENATKSYQEADISKKFEYRAQFWQGKEDTINLSMPESIDYYEHQMELRKIYHRDLLENPEKRGHSMGLAYAKKALNEAVKKHELAKKLWGELETEIQNEN